MKRYQVVFSPEAEEQLARLYGYLAGVASPATALSYTDNIVSYCEALSEVPHRGNIRNDLLPGLRITHYRKNTIIAFVVEETEVQILGIWYGGQNYEAEFDAES